MTPRFSGEKAYKHLLKMAHELPHRNSGSDNEKKAAEYIKNYFKSLGLDTITQSFEVNTGSTLAEHIILNGEKIQCKALPLSGSTGPEGVDGELFFIPSVVEEYVTSHIKGKILLTQGYYRKGIELLNKHRPLAVINIGRPTSTKLQHGWGSFNLKEKYGPIPTVNVLYQDGLKMLDHVGSNVKIVADIQEKKAESLNVVAELHGSDEPEVVIIIGGHYDTVPDEPGASDNAAGTAIIMELARVFKERGSKYTMRFMAWGSEELGCKGSEYDVNRLKKEHDAFTEKKEKSELDKLKLVINVDVQGARLGNNTAVAVGPVELETSVKLLAKETGVLINIGGGGGGISNGIYSSDGTSYSAAGIPSLNFIRGGTMGIHSILDTVEWLHPDGLTTTGVFIERFIQRYCNNAVVFPFEKTIPEDQKKNIEKYFVNKMRKPPGVP